MVVKRKRHGAQFKGQVAVVALSGLARDGVGLAREITTLGEHGQAAVLGAGEGLAQRRANPISGRLPSPGLVMVLALVRAVAIDCAFRCRCHTRTATTAARGPLSTQRHAQNIMRASSKPVVTATPVATRPGIMNE